MTQTPRHSKSLKHVSPTRLEDLLACPLRVAWSQSNQAEGRTPSGPSLRGLAAHLALERALAESESIESAWDWACSQLAKSETDPRKVPGSNRTRLRLIARFADLRGYIDNINPAEVLLETELRSKDSRVIGTADLLLVGETVTVVDYKSGLVADQGNVKDRYRRQALLYATLASEWLELPVEEAALFSLRQGLVRIDAGEQERRSTWDEALEALEAFNKAVPGEQVATPSDASCTWCPHCVYCEAAWQAHADGDVEKLLGGAAVAGQIESVPVAAANRRSALFITALFSGSQREAHVADVPTELLVGLQPGERVALAGLSRNPESRDSYSWTEGRSRLTAVSW